jgi:hypothetical protein
MAQNTSINGIRYDFTTIRLTGTTAPNFASIGFQFPVGVLQSISYDAEQDAGIVQGNTITMVGRTNGYGTGSGSLELLVSEFDDWVALVTGAGSVPLMSVFFDLSVSYNVNLIDVRTDSLRGIKITKVGAAQQKGNDAVTRTLDLSIARIYANGIALFGDPAQ